MQGILDWLGGLPPAALYAVLAGVSAIENIFPPFPADTVVAFGSFLAARGNASLVGAFAATWLGNVAGAAATFGLGRRYGSDALARRFLGGRGGAANERLKAMYGRHGIFALFVSRFLPGVRAIVPPFAGALRIPAPIALPTIALASGIWYGSIAYLAFSVGSNWTDLTAAMARQGRIIGIVATVIAAVAILWWWLRRRSGVGGDGR